MPKSDFISMNFVKRNSVIKLAYPFESDSLIRVTKASLLKGFDM